MMRISVGFLNLTGGLEKTIGFGTRPPIGLKEKQKLPFSCTGYSVRMLQLLTTEIETDLIIQGQISDVLPTARISVIEQKTMEKHLLGTRVLCGASDTMSGRLR